VCIFARFGQERTKDMPVHNVIVVAETGFSRRPKNKKYPYNARREGKRKRIEMTSVFGYSSSFYIGGFFGKGGQSLKM